MRRVWKVLIADDEPIIREGIREAVDWEKLNMRVAAEAEDGEEALEIMLEQEIDILLVDLNMPIMDGITLMKHIREKRPRCRIVIITGHDEFAYAQEAVRLHVDDYILKPANPEQLTRVMEQVRNELEAEVKQSEHLAAASKQIRRNFPLLRERFCLDWIEGNMSEEEITEQLRFLRLPVSCPKRICVIHWPEVYAERTLISEKDRQLYLFAIENIADELLHSYEKVRFRVPSGLLVICLWDAVPDPLFSDIENAVQSYLKINVTVHAETVTGNLSDIPAIYERCKTNVYRAYACSPIVRRARQAIRDEYADPDLTLKSVAASLQVSSVYLSRLIKQETGHSFVSLLTRTRIKKAVELLNSTDLPIHEIASKVGYDTQHYFSTAFKKVMGVSPNQYRKGERQADLPEG